jgi:hypothetical protein
MKRNESRAYKKDSMLFDQEILAMLEIAILFWEKIETAALPN